MKATRHATARPRKAASDAPIAPLAACATDISSKYTISSASMTVAVAFSEASAARETCEASARSEADEPKTAAAATAPDGTEGHEA